MNDQTDKRIRNNEEQGKLKASELRYRRLFETAKDGILLLDADTGRITDVNPFLEDLLGYSHTCLLYTSPSPRDRQKSRMPSSA